MTQPVLSLKHVSLRYGDRVAVQGLSLEVQRGETLGLLGPNGSGKSSTLSAIAGLHPPFSGTIRVGGLQERDDPLGYRAIIGLVPQDLALYEELTAVANLDFFGRLYRLSGAFLRQRVEELLQFVRLSDVAGQRVQTFSGGMKRRLNLACALLHEPALLLLDEPTVGLDAQSREAIYAILQGLQQRGCAVVLTTHHLEEAERLCDRVGVLEAGVLTACGTLEELYPAVDRSRWRSEETFARSGRLDAPCFGRAA